MGRLDISPVAQPRVYVAVLTACFVALPLAAFVGVRCGLLGLPFDPVDLAAAGGAGVVGLGMSSLLVVLARRGIVT